MRSSTPPASIALPKVPLKSYSTKIITVNRLKLVAWRSAEVLLYGGRTLKTYWNSPCTYCSIALQLHHKQCPTEARGHDKYKCKLTKATQMLMSNSQHSQVFPLPDILLWEVYHLCLVSQSSGFEPP